MLILKNSLIVLTGSEEAKPGIPGAPSPRSHPFEVIMSYDGLVLTIGICRHLLLMTMKSPRDWTRKRLMSCPSFDFMGLSKVAEDSKSFNRFAARLKKQRVLGFDIECKPNFKRGPNNPPALIQLATADRAFLFRLYPVMKLGPLVDILADPEIIKTGVAIKDDLKNLNKIEEFKKRLALKT